MNKTKIIHSLLSLFVALGLTGTPAQAALVDSATAKEFASIAALKNLTLKVVSRNIVERTDTHIIAEVVLNNKYTGDIHIYDKSPIAPTLGQLPTVFVLSGIHSGRDSIFLVPGIPNLRVVTLEYPVDLEKQGSDFMESAVRNLPRMISQIVASYLWLNQQSDVDTKNIYSLNISFGTYIAPAAFRILGELGYYPSRTIFAFGGSSFESFVEPYLSGKITSRADNQKLIEVAKRVAREADLSRHLKYLHGPFLVIRGLQDEVIPAESTMSLVGSLSEPPTIVDLNTGHINTNTVDTIDLTFKAIMDWIGLPPQ